LCDTFDFELISPREDGIIQDETSRQHVKQLNEGIAVLTRRQREAIYLRFYQNLSYDEIAKLMTMKVESVYNVISKAISLLKNTVLFLLLIVSLWQ
jgi:RNA polymerase sigma factor (sigma-70 family)